MEADQTGGRPRGFVCGRGLLSKVESAQMKAVASATPTPEDLKKFGLDKPQATINLHMGSARATFLVGAKADDMTVYVRDTSKPDVFTVDNGTADDLKKTADDYRRKEFFDFRAFNATHVELTHNGQTVVFDRVKAKDDKSPDTWHRASPNPGHPDRRESGAAPRWPGRHSRDVVRRQERENRPQRAGADGPRQIRGWQEGRTRHPGQERHRRVLRRAPTILTPGKIEAEKLDEALKSLDELGEMTGRSLLKQRRGVRYAARNHDRRCRGGARRLPSAADAFAADASLLPAASPVRASSTCSTRLIALLPIRRLATARGAWLAKSLTVLGDVLYTLNAVQAS